MDKEPKKPVLERYASLKWLLFAGAIAVGAAGVMLGSSVVAGEGISAAALELGGIGAINSVGSGKNNKKT